MINVCAVVQAAVEYGGTTGGNALSGLPQWAQDSVSWALEHRVLLLVAAGLLILILAISGRKRRP
jgi:hypothetical protein